MGLRLPEPEEVFLSWLLAQPSGSDLGPAVDDQIERLAGYAGVHDGPRRLAGLFREFRESLPEPVLQ